MTKPKLAKPKSSAKTAASGQSAPSLIISPAGTGSARQQPAGNFAAIFTGSGPQPVNDPSIYGPDGELAKGSGATPRIVLGPTGEPVDAQARSGEAPIYDAAGRVASGPDRLPRVVLDPSGNVVAAPDRNTFPDFTAVSPGLKNVAIQEAAKLSGQLGIPIRADRMLVAPWIGRVYNDKGEYTSQSSSEGWERNESRFWSEYERLFPDDYASLNSDGTISIEFATRMGWPTEGPNSVVGDSLEHHHVANGTLVAAVPSKLHEGASGKIHGKFRDLSSAAGALTKSESKPQSKVGKKSKGGQNPPKSQPTPVSSPPPAVQPLEPTAPTTPTTPTAPAAEPPASAEPAVDSNAEAHVQAPQAQSSSADPTVPVSSIEQASPTSAAAPSIPESPNRAEREPLEQFQSPTEIYGPGTPGLSGGGEMMGGAGALLAEIEVVLEHEAEVRDARLGGSLRTLRWWLERGVIPPAKGVIDHWISSAERVEGIDEITKAVRQGKLQGVEVGRLNQPQQYEAFEKWARANIHTTEDLYFHFVHHLDSGVNWNLESDQWEVITWEWGELGINNVTRSAEPDERISAFMNRLRAPLLARTQNEIDLLGRRQAALDPGANAHIAGKRRFRDGGWIDRSLYDPYSMATLILRLQWKSPPLFYEITAPGIPSDYALVTGADFHTYFTIHHFRTLYGTTAPGPTIGPPNRYDATRPDTGWNGIHLPVALILREALTNDVDEVVRRGQ